MPRCRTLVPWPRRSGTITACPNDCCRNIASACISLRLLFQSCTRISGTVVFFSGPGIVGALNDHAVLGVERDVLECLFVGFGRRLLGLSPQRRLGPISTTTDETAWLRHAARRVLAGLENRVVGSWFRHFPSMYSIDAPVTLPILSRATSGRQRSPRNPSCSRPRSPLSSTPLRPWPSRLVVSSAR